MRTLALTGPSVTTPLASRISCATCCSSTVSLFPSQFCQAHLYSPSQPMKFFPYAPFFELGITSGAVLETRPESMSVHEILLLGEEIMVM